MGTLTHTKANLAQRKSRIRAVVNGDSRRPRLSIFISGHHVSAQLIDDTKQATVTAISTVGKKDAGNTLTEKAGWVGAEIAKKAKTAKIKQVVLDRNGRRYQGRIKTLAEAARAGGLEF